MNDSMTTFGERGARLRLHVIAVLWVVYLLICLGLGYPTLARYSPPRTPGVNDSADYAAMVEHDARDVAARAAAAGKAEARGAHRRYRLLLPLIAKPFHRLAVGRIGSWDPVMFGLLVSTSIFMATTATALVAAAVLAGTGYHAGLLGGTLLLLNFWVANHFLAGMVDGGEACLAALLTVALLSRRWWMLLPLGIAGALTKETFVVLGSVFAAAWWLIEWRRERKMNGRALVWIGAMGLSGVATVLLVRWFVSSSRETPAAIVDKFATGSMFFNLMDCLTNAEFWYGLVWLLPLSLWSLRKLPLTWSFGAGSAALAALILGAYHGAGGGNVARPIFSMIGPLLSLAAAVTLIRLGGSVHTAESGSRHES